MAVAPIALAAAIGGSTGYWDACYEIAVREPTLTIALFSLLAFGAWRVGFGAPPRLSALALTVARVSVILVNFGFWSARFGATLLAGSGTIWKPSTGPSPAFQPSSSQPRGRLSSSPPVPGDRNGRRFLVNAAATFAAINFCTQWFEHLGLDPLTVIGGGVAAIGAGYALWRYNARAAAA